MPGLPLTTTIGSYAHTRALKDGRVNSEKLDLQHIEISPIISVFRRMIRGLEFDVSEMSLSTYLCALAHNIPITAIPIFLARGLHHGSISYNVNSGINSPGDLAGRRVGVRGYTVTTGVWVRGILQTCYGVDPSSVTWVLNWDEHVAEYVAPPNVVAGPEGGNLADMLISGEIDAAIGVGKVDSPDIQPLIPDARNAAIEHLKDTGIYPINHTLVVKNDVLESYPWLPVELYSMFKTAKETGLQQLGSGGQLDPQDQELEQMKVALGGDPVPYGLEANRKTLECFIQYNVDQKVIPRTVDVEDIFDNSTLRLE